MSIDSNWFACGIPVRSINWVSSKQQEDIAFSTRACNYNNEREENCFARLLDFSLTQNM
jgi:hypothetical protein